jgi:hypothetical protein
MFLLIIQQIHRTYQADYLTFQQCLLLSLIPETNWFYNFAHSKDIQIIQHNLGVFLTADHKCLLINHTTLCENFNLSPNDNPFTDPFHESDMPPLPITDQDHILHATWLRFYYNEPLYQTIIASYNLIKVLPATFQQTVSTFLTQSFNTLTDAFTYISNLPIQAFSFNPLMMFTVKQKFTTTDPYQYFDPELQRFRHCPLRTQKCWQIPEGYEFKHDRDSVPHKWYYWELKLPEPDFDDDWNDEDPMWIDE